MFSSPHNTPGDIAAVVWRTLDEAKKDGFEEVAMGKIIVREDVSSKSLVVHVKQTNPFRPRSVVKIRKTIQFAEISDDDANRRFSVVTFHPEDTDKEEETWKLWKQVYQHSSSAPRRTYLSQLFGLCRSSKPALVFHEELVGGEEIIEHYTRTPIVYSYLWYRHVASYRTIFEDGALKRFSIPLSEHYRNWSFNLSSRTWLYDVASIAFSDVEDDSPAVFFDNPPFLPSHCNPKLDPEEILREVPNYLQLISTLKSKPSVKDLEHLLSQGVLIFGSVVDCTKPEILGHFPSVCSPQWYHKSMNLDVQISYSTSVPSRLNLDLAKDSGRLNLRFSLRLPLKERERLRVAYLTQSLAFNTKRSDLMLIEEIRFKLAGNFTTNPSSHRPPIYLFVPPPSLEWTSDGVPFIRWPLANPFFYWSFDSEGKDYIAKEEWHRYGIPELKVKDIWIGSNWPEELYESARAYLNLSDYSDVGGEQFAVENGYPVLVEGSQFESRF
ncbi:hypothetical protein L218DRAFT_134172 [Marasmius fiardii PR-910]|nr:hypothetical protein L218DRAFT_134172 [Marasmius fiardii PR-910]